MIKKKKNRQEWHDKRGLRLIIGLNITLMLIVSAFEWKSKYDENLMERQPVEDVFVENIPITEQKPPEPPKPKKVLANPIETTEEVEIEQPELLIDLNDLTIDDIKEIVEEPPEEEPEVYNSGIVEHQPQPLNGYEGFYTFIAKNMKYPRFARQNGVEGKVFVQFIIDETGKMTDFNIIRGVGSGCDEEALRVLNMVPNWDPGRQRGRPVKVRMVLPITFKLN